MNEAETCRTLVRPKLETAGWEANGDTFYREQIGITAGRIVLPGGKPRRLKKKIPDFLLYFTRDVLLAVVEAKSNIRPAGDGLQQAKDYAQILGLYFAFATNGTKVIEYDYFTHTETERADFPTPTELWQRYLKGMSLAPGYTDALLVPDYHWPDKRPRYFQRVAIERALQAIVGKQQRRCLLTLATGTGKTTVAFQICWKLWSAYWNAKGEPKRRPRILFLADRNKLVDDPKDRDFAPFGDTRLRIQGKAEKGREMYFALYQSLAGADGVPGLYQQYARDYFDLIVIDECHRGSANDEGRWREILDYFEPAYQLGMTATPLREENKDSYLYFGNPLYTYSLKQGIEDGFLAPYRVHRIVTSFDAIGWRPNKGQKDKDKNPIPDRLFQTKDFERVISIEARNKAVAVHLTNFLKRNGRYDKTIVFCADQDHADIMRQELHNLNKDLAPAAVQVGSSYVARVTADEGERGAGFLDDFQDLEKDFPVILTTSQLLTTGVDAPTCRNVVLFRPVNSMTEFKQIIGRGTRCREDKGKLFFNILDYTGSATEKFADPDFDGQPPEVTAEEIDEYGQTVATETTTNPEPDEDFNVPAGILPEQTGGRVKLRVHGGPGWIDTEVTYDLDASGKQLRVGDMPRFTAEEVRDLFADADALRTQWANPEGRKAVLEELDQRAIDLRVLAAEVGEPDADPFDLLCHLAYKSPLLTRKQRADKLRASAAAFLAGFGPPARPVLEALIDKYVEHGIGEFELPDALKVPPLSAFGPPGEIVARFSGPSQLLAAVDALQEKLYAG
ncbi:dead deah box helicase : EcoEI R domain protein OS=Xanthobacter autotrophicus (strain ATCC BAA-1158 / Py2) GN=Xaut_0785 PE=4 SV=1: ResIII: Helicase_C: EcoEI_R_C [Gemmata massiliana]|uniref:Helicase ATP-binding domain-containing protein n=1 Tax=Gemmata massiliana TaxID=1210884 RepID=A0A6P2CUU7_9BACT|nr:DEAD/DEAH box helicase family protein [Gemmata massiliana]VTR92761.1 dead deah box helicase : EcoEI R domain protein OS=Xanthobacter autotrophicus (strain ATCC BAA-1158 / Py2) GN=Xaut_0785 PE=4 SV=1: ResIII: Helicase_C: EcoEI_R_C [Gemmata massiliana]